VPTRGARLVVVALIAAAVSTACGAAESPETRTVSTASPVTTTSSPAPTTTRTTSPTTTSRTTTTTSSSPTTVTASQIRSLSLCEALELYTEDRIGYFIYGKKAGAACRNGDAGADDVTLCESIYDEQGNLRTLDGKTIDDDIVAACPEPQRTDDGEAEAEAYLAAVRSGGPRPALSSLSCAALDHLADHYLRNAEAAYVGTQADQYRNAYLRVNTEVMRRCT
jgi:hypothetical protein